MARKKSPPLTSDEVKDAADRAEGIKPTRKVGRPTSYDPKFVQQAQKLCGLGATDIEVADFFGIASSTLYKWKNEHPEFSEATQVGKAAADDRVERSLYQRAVGYTFESEKVFQFQGEIVRAPIREHVPPDTTAASFWLRNRRSQQWRDIHRVEHGEPGEFEAMADDELYREAAREAAELGMMDAGDTQH